MHENEDRATRPAAPDLPPDLRYAAHARARMPELAPDADPDQFELGYLLLHFAYMLLTDLESSVHRPRGWTVPGFRVMFKLWVLGPTQPGRLAELSVMSRSALTNAVNTLERDGLVERRRTPEDKRAVFVALTARGQAAVAEAFTAHAERESAWFAALAPDARAELTTLLTRLIAARPTTDRADA
ncbi:MarR family winged helix-turn-helix transcriptional regulator [Yinghuangia seranimata]|uniref:MarR family winged helix-turn-helix transcriptional regulator n=1 Tax=Yinghuangia seranimata TaxID=408067 RepID=UPI00248C77F7|nr:MarR family transcriptional regulator [Yinghuangia seranimata]MDI2132163.1 MarR family transcriptional regulator [Yinghuangia seranimata]